MMGLLGKLDRSDRWDVTAFMMNELSVTLSHRGVVTLNPWGDKKWSTLAKKLEHMMRKRY